MYISMFACMVCMCLTKMYIKLGLESEIFACVSASGSQCSAAAAMRFTFNVYLCNEATMPQCHQAATVSPQSANGSRQSTRVYAASLSHHLSPRVARRPSRLVATRCWQVAREKWNCLQRSWVAQRVAIASNCYGFEASRPNCHFIAAFWI